MAHDDHTAREVVDERLEPLEPGEVEVVGRLVEQEHVEAAEQDGRERRACRFTARQDARRRVEQPVLGQPDVGAHARGRARRGRDRRPRGRRRARRCTRRPRSSRLRRASAAAARSSSASAAVTPVRRARNASSVSSRALGLLGQVARPAARAACAVTVPRSGRSSPASRRSSVVLPTPFGPTTPRRVRGPIDDVDPVEHGVRHRARARGHGRRARRRTTKRCEGDGMRDPRGRGGGRRAGGISRSHAGHGSRRSPTRSLISDMGTTRPPG